MLFASKKETEEDITRRVSRRVERYLEKLKMHQQSLPKAQVSQDQHATPELPSEFEDDAPTLILRARAQSQTPVPSEPATEPIVSSAAVRSEFGELQPERGARTRASEPLGSKKSALKIVSGDSHSEAEQLSNFGVPGDSDFERFQGETSAAQSKIDEDSLDLGRFAEVSRYVVTEKKSEKRRGLDTLATKQADSQVEAPGAEPPNLFLSSRSTIIVFSVLGIAILAVLYFLLAFDKYVY